MGATRRSSPWALGGLTVSALGVRVWNEFWDDEVSDRAAALSYYFLFSLFPALLFLASLLGFLPIPDLMERLMRYVEPVLPARVAFTIRQTLAEVLQGHAGLLSVGALVALWSASNGMASLMTALNVAYEATDPRPWWKRRLLAIALTLAFSLFILAALVLMVFGPRLGAAVAGWLGLGGLFAVTWNLLSVPVVVLLALVGIELVYYLAPAVEQPWRWLTPGSAVALVLWLAMSYGLRLYLAYFGNYNAMYGSIGGVILLMLWLYLTGVVLLLGAEVNSEIEHAAARREGGRGERGSLTRVGLAADIVSPRRQPVAGRP